MVQIGDKIKILSSRGDVDRMKHAVGDIVTVLCTSGRTVYINNKSVSCGSMCSCGKHEWSLSSEEYEIVEEKTPGDSSFKTGDCVIITKDKNNGGGLHVGWNIPGAFIGKIGYLGDRSYEGWYIYDTRENALNCDINNYFGSHKIGTFELYGADKPAESRTLHSASHTRKYTRTKPPSCGFKVGDVVGLHEDSGYSYASDNPLWSVKHGHIKGKVVELRGDERIKVKWENGEWNTYKQTDLFIPREPGFKKWSASRPGYKKPESTHLFFDEAQEWPHGLIVDPELFKGMEWSMGCDFGADENVGMFGQVITKPKIKKTMLKKLSDFILKSTDVKTQALLKVGYLNGDLEPTPEGWSALQEILFFENRDKLVEKAEWKIKEIEAASKK